MLFQQRASHPIWDFTGPSPDNTFLLQVCRIMRHEVLPLFHQFGVVSLLAQDETLPLTSPDVLQGIRRVKVNICCVGYDADQALLDLQTAFPQIKVIEFFIESPQADIQPNRTMFEKHFLPKNGTSSREQPSDASVTPELNTTTLHAACDLHRGIGKADWILKHKDILEAHCNAAAAPALQVLVHFRMYFVFAGPKNGHEDFAFAIQPYIQVLNSMVATLDLRQRTVTIWGDLGTHTSTFEQIGWDTA